MEKWPAPPTGITKHWININTVASDKEGATTPSYKLIVGKKKYGNGTEKVEATTFKIICKDRDRLYLKLLMSATWRHEVKPRGVFIPSHTNLITLPKIYKQLLNNHNAHIQNTTSVAVESLHPTVLDKEIAVGTEKVTT
eukprot:7551127-Ditylum_brightwellii.AAC.1